MKINILLALPGGWEWAIIIGVILLFFGANRIPELMKGLGSGVKEFKKGLKDEDTNKDKDAEKK